MNKEMDIALVGKGKWGQNYIKTLSSLEDGGFSQELVKTRNYPELFERDDIEGVIIASRTDTHFAIAKDFIERDYSVLIEKPVTRTYKEALELQRLHSEHKQRVAMAGHIQIYDPGYQELKKNLSRVGAVQELIFKGSQEEARTDSTVLENWGPHPIYMFMDLLGKNPMSVTGNEIEKDNLHLVFDFGSGTIGNTYIGMISSERKREFSVVGSQGTLTLDWAGEKILTFTDIHGQETKLSFPTEKSPLELEIREFMECIETGREPKTPLSQGVTVMKIIDDLQKQLG